MSVASATNAILSSGVTLRTAEGSIQLLAGSGSPSGVVSANKGSLYLNTVGSSTSTRAYICTTSGSTTAWSAVTTAA